MSRQTDDREPQEPEEQHQLLRLGVRAEVAATLLSDEGRELAHEMSTRSIAIPLDQLCRVPRIVAAAGGADKAVAVVAASPILREVVPLLLQARPVPRRYAGSALLGGGWVDVVSSPPQPANAATLAVTSGRIR